MTVLAAGSYAYLSYALYKTLHHPKAEIYGLAAACTISLLPYTLVVMGATNGKLESKAKESREWSITDEAVEKDLAKGESSKELLDYWATLNVVRSIFPLLGAAFGAWATLK